MTAELPPLLQVLIALVSLAGTLLALAGTVLTGVKSVANWGESRARVDFTKAQAATLVTEAEAKAYLLRAQAQAALDVAAAQKIAAAATAASLEAQSKADVIAAAVREKDVGTLERQTILRTLELMLAKVEGVKTTAETTLEGVTLANQQLTASMNTANRHPDSPMSTEQADAELLKHRLTDKNVAEGAKAPPSPLQSIPAPPVVEAEPPAPQLTVAVKKDDGVEVVSGNAVVITTATEPPTAPVQPEVPKEGNT